MTQSTKDRLVALAVAAATLALAMSLAGCATAPAKTERSVWKPWTWFRRDSVATVEKAKDDEQKILARAVTNQSAILSGASGYTFATGEALKRATNQEPAVKVAGDMNDRAAALLPKPSVEDVTNYKRIIAGLLSTNETDRSTAAAELSAKDAKIAQLQLLAEQLKAAGDNARRDYEAKVTELGAKFQSEQQTADKWRQHQAKTWLGRIFDVIGPAGLIALSVAFPMTAPLAGRAFGWLSRVMPSSSIVTGVVSRAGYENVVAGAAKVREVLKNGAPAAPTLLEAADKALTAAQSPDDVPLVNATRVRIARREARLKAKKNAAAAAAGVTI